MTNAIACYSPDYFTARRRFRAAALRAGFQLEVHRIASTGPGGRELAMDVALAGGRDAQNALVVSSGTHGVEGFFGSAVQLAFLEHVPRSLWTSGLRCVLIHALNPFGFAWLRRVNEDNVDPNRNFLLRGESYEGSPPAYRELDAFLNPRRPPSWWDPLSSFVQAGIEIRRHGMAAARQAVAGGQYDFPRGLFYGGAAPIQSTTILGDNIARWIGSAPRVLHMDLHTGLGPWATYKLLLDSVVSDAGQAWLRAEFGADRVENLADAAPRAAYRARGSMGRWCQERCQDGEYVFLTAEFGTYSPLAVLARLRAENQAHHWGACEDVRCRAGRRLRAVFCPGSPAWRRQALSRGVLMVRKALEAVLGFSARQN
jgi:hypothetical protein